MSNEIIIVPTHEYTYKNRKVTVIQKDDKRQRAEVIDTHLYRKDGAGFFINYSELTTS